MGASFSSFSSDVVWRICRIILNIWIKENVKMVKINESMTVKELMDLGMTVNILDPSIRTPKTEEQAREVLTGLDNYDSERVEKHEIRGSTWVSMRAKNNQLNVSVFYDLEGELH